MMLRYTRQRVCASVVWRSFSSSEIPLNDPKQIRQDHNHCVDLVKQRDREGYLCGLLMPDAVAKHYFALRAFNVELASIKASSIALTNRASSEEHGGIGQKMRMTWWREALNEIYNSNKNGEGKHGGEQPTTNKDSSIPNELLSSISQSYWHNPVVRALYHAVQESNLTRRFLERLLDAREADLEITQLPTMQSAIMYAEDSCSSLMYLSLECCDVRQDEADEVASNVGVGWGLVTALRSTVHRAVMGEMSIPIELFDARNVPSDYIVARLDAEYAPNADNEASLKEAVQHMAYVSYTHLEKARKGQEENVPKSARSALLPAVPALHYLQRLKEADYNVFHETLLQPEHHRLVMLAMMARAWWSGKI